MNVDAASPSLTLTNEEGSKSGTFKLRVVHFYQQTQKVVSYYFNIEIFIGPFVIHNNCSFQNTLPSLTVLPEKSYRLFINYVMFS